MNGKVEKINLPLTYTHYTDNILVYKQTDMWNFNVWKRAGWSVYSSTVFV